MKFRFLTVMLFMCMNINAQIKPIVPASPEGAALAKMVNYPVNLNTGVPNISIPLYTVESGGMTLPITLNYQASGFKINERATSVGLGWSLSSDIQIVRTINGLDDFTPVTGYIANTKMRARYGGYASYPLFENNYFYGRNMYDIAAGIVDGAPDKFNYRLLNKSGSFYFQKNASGTSYVIVPVPYENIKISYNNGQFTILDTDGTTYVFGSQGTSSLATQAERGEDISGDMVSSSGGFCAACKVSAWKVKQISNAAQTESFTFTYQKKADEKYITRPDAVEYFNNESPCGLTAYMQSQHINSPDYESLVGSRPFYYLSSPKYFEHFSDKPSIFHMPYLTSQYEIVDKTYSANQFLYSSSSGVAGVVLSKIEFNGGKVLFNSTDKLNSIQVRDKNDVTLRSYNFFQTYTNANYINEAKIANGPDFKGTLYLDSIQVEKSNVVFERYKLLYTEKFCFGSHLKGKDAWGYANASTAEQSSTNTQSYVPFVNIMQRFYKDLDMGCLNFLEDAIFNIGNPFTTESPSMEEAKRGMLKKIVYPTGGYVDFDFESNKYREQMNYDFLLAVKMGGGLRIKTISYFDGTSVKPVSQKYYTYGDLEDGIGLHINPPSRTFDGINYKYNTYSFDQTTAYITGAASANFGDEFEPVESNCYTRECLKIKAREKKTTYLPASSLSTNYPNGAPVYYTKVTEYNSDLGVNTGKTVNTFYPPFEFYDYDNRPFVSSKIPGTSIDVLNTDGLMGQQKSLEEYKYENKKYVLQHKKEFVYEKYSRPERLTVVYSSFKTIYQVIGGTFNGGNMELYNTNYMLSDSDPNQDYIAGEYSIEVGKLLLKSETETWKRDNSTFSQTTAYHYDNNQYVQPSRIVTTNSKGQEITKYLSYSYDFANQDLYAQMKAKNMISQVIEEQVYNNTLEKEISKVRTNYKKVNFGSGFFVPQSIVQSNAGGPMDTLIKYDQYDLKANVIQTTEKGGLVKSYIWAYNYKYPVAEITGLDYATATAGISIPNLQAIDNDSEMITALSGLRSSFSNALVRTFTFKPLLGVSSASDHSGLTSFYEYDDFGRLVVIRDQNHNIKKKNEYSMKGTNSFYANANFYVNSPIMETFYKVCNDQSIRSFNSVIQGGEQPGGTATFAHNSAQEALEMQAANYEAGCLIPDNSPYVKLSLYSIFYVSQFFPPKPTTLMIDFIQDGSIVASRKFSYTNMTPVLLYLPPGEYTVSFRQFENFNESIIGCYVETPGQPTINIITGNTMNLVAGTDYALFAHNVF